MSAFSHAQLTHAVKALRQIAPSIEIHRLNWDGPPDDRTRQWTHLTCTSSGKDAAALIGDKRLPKLPKRVSWGYWATDPGVRGYDIRRQRGGAMFMHVWVNENSPASLSSFTVSAIRAMAPDGPQTAAECRRHLRKVLENMAILHRDVLRGMLTRIPDCERFGFREVDIDRMVRMQDDFGEALLKAFDVAPMEDAVKASERQRLGLRLVVDNSGQERSHEPAAI
jgi:hypothetical protein